MRKSPKVKRRVGDIVSVPLGSGRMGYGVVQEEPLVSFFDFCTSAGAETPPVDEIALKPIAFRVWVMNYALTDRLWPVIGKIKIPASIMRAPWFFKQDPLSKKVTLTRGGAEEVAASLGEAEGIERAAVWDPEHVADRLRDHFDGRPNMWLESLKPRT